MDNAMIRTPSPLSLMQIRNDLYRLRIPLLNSPLKCINSYILLGSDRNLLIDTAYNSAGCIDEIVAALEYLDIEPDSFDILLTHFHNDHSGASTSVISENRNIYFPGLEQPYYDFNGNMNFYTESRRMRYLQEGLSEKEFNEMMLFRTVDAAPPNFNSKNLVPINAGDIITVGSYRLEAVHTPGHSPGHMCYYDKNHKIMFTGDHILFDISPNIIPWPSSGEDTLSNYLSSLYKVLEYDVDLALPGHRETGNLEERITDLIKHHKARLAECENIIHDFPYSNALDITKRLTWNVSTKGGIAELPLSVRRYAFGECLAHLDYLILKNRIKKRMDEGAYRYYF